MDFVKIVLGTFLLAIAFCMATAWVVMMAINIILPEANVTEHYVAIAMAIAIMLAIVATAYEIRWTRKLRRHLWAHSRRPRF